MASIDANAQRRLDEAVALAKTLPMTSLADVLAVVAKAGGVTNAARAQVRWTANRALNAREAADAAIDGAGLLWVAERDACLHCLAYSGHVVRPGEAFPPDLTLHTNKHGVPSPLRRPPGLGPLWYPPLHPNCRCRVRAWDGNVEMARGLRREARRSVARGWSAYASDGARLWAADLLVKRADDPDLPREVPKSVTDRAARDLKRGQFSTRHRSRVPTLRAG